MNSGYSGCGSVWKWAIAPIDHFNEMGKMMNQWNWVPRFNNRDWVEAGWSFCHWFWPDIQCGGWNNRVKPWKVVLLRKRIPLARNQKSTFFAEPQQICYPLVMTNSLLWKITIFNGKINYFYGHFPSFFHENPRVAPWQVSREGHRRAVSSAPQKNVPSGSGTACLAGVSLGIAQVRWEEVGAEVGAPVSSFIVIYGDLWWFNWDLLVI